MIKINTVDLSFYVRYGDHSVIVFYHSFLNVHYRNHNHYLTVTWPFMNNHGQGDVTVTVMNGNGERSKTIINEQSRNGHGIRKINCIKRSIPF